MDEEAHIPVSDDALTFEPSEFAIVYESVARASMEIAAQRRRSLGAAITGGDSPEAARRARGATLSSAFAPLRERYAGEPERYQSAVRRLTALALLIKTGRLRGHIRSDAQGIQLDRAVLAAAATVRLTRAGEFKVEPFLKEVKRHGGGGGRKKSEPSGDAS